MPCTDRTLLILYIRLILLLASEMLSIESTCVFLTEKGRMAHSETYRGRPGIHFRFLGHRRLELHRLKIMARDSAGNYGTDHLTEAEYFSRKVQSQHMAHADILDTEGPPKGASADRNDEGPAIGRIGPPHHHHTHIQINGNPF